MTEDISNRSEKISNHFNAVMQFSQLSISSAILLNGAAATAILAFFSGEGASNPPIPLDVLKAALRTFALGAVLGGAACIAAFFTRWLYLQQALDKEKCACWVKLGTRVFNFVAVSVTIASFGAFLAGVLRAS